MRQKTVLFLILFWSSILLQIACNSVSEKDNKEGDKRKHEQVHPSRDSSVAVGSNRVHSSSRATGIIRESLGSDNSNMIWIAGGTFKMGSTSFADSQPIHEIELEGFWIDEHEVTNAQFAHFVEATGYQTTSERVLDPADFPDVSLDMLVPGSLVFTPSHTIIDKEDEHWWKHVAGANWRHPEGPGSGIEEKRNYPVVQISYEDATAYADWAGKRLPTEAEWEYAARGILKNTVYYWGDELKPEGKWVENVYQGNFPLNNTVEDGYEGPSPVKSFPENAFGLYDMGGNVSEWCLDFYHLNYYKSSPKRNPRGPANSYDPQEPRILKRVERGGSFLSNNHFYKGYATGSREKEAIGTARNNLGFRCVSDNPPPSIKE